MVPSDLSESPRSEVSKVRWFTEGVSVIGCYLRNNYELPVGQLCILIYSHEVSRSPGVRSQSFL